MSKEIKKLSCRETTHLVLSARDSPLHADQEMELDGHLRTCTKCRTARRQFAQMFSQLDTLLARDQKP